MSRDGEGAPTRRLREVAADQHRPSEATTRRSEHRPPAAAIVIVIDAHGTRLVSSAQLEGEQERLEGWLARRPREAWLVRAALEIQGAQRVASAARDRSAQ